MNRRFWPFSGKPRPPAVADLLPQFEQDLREIVRDFPARLTLLDVYSAYRLILGRPPESVDVCRHHAASSDPKTMVGVFLESPEFRLSRTIPIAPEIPVMAERPDGMRIHFYLSDSHVGWALAAGEYDSSQAQLIRAHVRPGFHCLDLGANIGPFTLQMGAQVGPGGAVYAFEPYPKNFQLLQRNISANGMDRWVKAFPVAVHSEPGKIRLFFDNLTSFGYWAVFTSAEEQDGSLGSIEVERVRLDDLIAADEKIDFIKMDIEGAEVAALKGMRRILTAWHPTISLEFNPLMLKTGGGVEPRAVLDQLRGLGYRLVQLDRLLAGDSSEFEDSAICVNLVALPQ